MTTEIITQAEVAAAKKEAHAGLSLAHVAETLAITDSNSYALADKTLNSINKVRKAIADRMDLILSPINEARNQVLALRKELDGPPAVAEALLRDKMKQFKLLEMRQEQEERGRIAREAEALRQQAEALRQKEEAAKTPQLQARIATQRMALEVKADQKAEEKPAEAVRVSGSTTRPVNKIRIHNKAAFISGLFAGKCPGVMEDLDVMEAIEKCLSRLYKANPPMVSRYLGLEEYDDVTIVRR